MAFLRRLFLYLIGVGLGSVLVWFMLLRDRDLAAWLPEDVIKEKVVAFSWSFDKDAQCVKEFALSDSVAFTQWIQTMEVNFGKSNTRKQSCPVYHCGPGEGSQPAPFKTLSIMLCDSTVTFTGAVRCL